MVTKDDVEKFLENFYLKVKVFGIRFRVMIATRTAMLCLNWKSPQDFVKPLLCVGMVGLFRSPITDELNKHGEMWVFGKDVKGTEVYIKISMGVPNSHSICISFHVAEHPMNYPFKES